MGGWVENWAGGLCERVISLIPFRAVTGTTHYRLPTYCVLPALQGVAHCLFIKLVARLKILSQAVA